MATQIFQPRTPDAGTVHWFKQCVERSHIEDFTDKVTVTPGLANCILQNNPNNRNLSEKKVREYASDMAGGRWVYNMEPIIIAVSGELNDGQHRLQAIIESNIPQTFLIAFGASRESRTTLDQGQGRTAGHYLAMQGVESGKACASIANSVIGLETSGGKNIRSGATHAEIVERVKADQDIRSAAHFANTVARYARGLLTPSQIGTCHYMFGKHDVADAERYLTQVCVGENIKRGDPAFAVRQALGSMEREGRLDRIELAFRGWVAFRQGRKLTLAKVLGTLPALI